MKKTVNFKMIELARLSRGQTQKDLVSSVKTVNQSTLSKIEKGLLPIPQGFLEKLSTVLNYPLDFFYQEELKTPFSNIYFRKRTTIPQKKLDVIFTDVKIVLKSLDILLSEIDLKEYKRYTFNLTDGWTPKSVAIRMREIMKIQFGPIKNLISLIENEGIIVYLYDSLEDKFDGLTAYSDNGYPVIFVNKNMPNDRIKYTICHEYAHLILHIPCDVEPWRDVETEANEFASEFLMPERDCAKDLSPLTYNKLTILKSYWGISKAAIIRRAKTIGTIDESTYMYLMIELGRRNERKKETGFVEIDEPKNIKEVLHLLKSELHYSDDLIADQLHLNTEHYLRLFDNKNSLNIKLRSLKVAI